MNHSIPRAGLRPRAVAFIVDVFTVSAIVSVVGLSLANMTSGNIRIREIIGGRIHCVAEEALPAGLKPHLNTRVDRLQRCTRELLGVPYDWSLTFRAKSQEIVDASASAMITVPLSPLGRTTDALYLDSLVLLLFGVYAFIAEWRFGATFGKRILGIQVRSLTGAPIGPWRSAKRAMVRVAAIGPSTIVTASATGSTTLIWWLFEHPACKIIGGVLIALWSVAFAANFVVATTGRALPWHDRWAGTEAITKRNDRGMRNIRDLPVRSSPVPSWLVRGSDNR